MLGENAAFLSGGYRKMHFQFWVLYLLFNMLSTYISPSNIDSALGSMKHGVSYHNSNRDTRCSVCNMWLICSRLTATDSDYARSRILYD
jgi:hypothetical protein